MLIPPDPQIPDGAVSFDETYLLELVRARMPFGRYKDCLLVDLPETYVMWFARKGFPKGKLGGMLQSLYEIKLNGLEPMLDPIRRLAGTARSHAK
jgi:uncharacterized protein (DUF3820 family)